MPCAQVVADAVSPAVERVRVSLAVRNVLISELPSRFGEEGGGGTQDISGSKRVQAALISLQVFPL